MEENTMNVTVTNNEAMAPVLPTEVSVPAISDDKSSLIFGIAGAAVCLLAVPTVVKGVKWTVTKVKGLFKSKEVKPEEANDEEVAE